MSVFVVANSALTKKGGWGVGGEPKMKNPPQTHTCTRTEEEKLHICILSKVFVYSLEMLAALSGLWNIIKVSSLFEKEMNECLTFS